MVTILEVQWCTWFVEDRTSQDGEPKSGRLKTSTNEENMGRKIREIAPIQDIPKSTDHEIVYDTLRYRKVSVLWVPRMLTEDHNLKKVKISNNSFCCDANKTI